MVDLRAAGDTGHQVSQQRRFGDLRPAHGTSTRQMLTISHGQACLIAAALPGV